MSEDDQKKAIERANSYRQMMELWAWKDFFKFIEDLRREALESAIEKDSIKDVQVQRGIVKAVDKIQSEIDYILAGV